MRAERRAAILFSIKLFAAAARDRQTVSPEGNAISTLIEGVSIRDVPTHIDERGSVVEIYDTRWRWHPAPIVFAHCFTIRPGFAKGWGLALNFTKTDTSYCRATWTLCFMTRSRSLYLRPGLQDCDERDEPPVDQYPEVRVARGT